MALTPQHLAAVDIEERHIPGPAGAPDVRVVIYRPRGATGSLPLVVHAHGGGFVMLRPESLAAIDADIATFGSVVVSVDYRLAPEHPFPAAPEDCYAALCWAVDALDVDADRVIVHGGSAGGALAAAMTLMARDRGGPRIAFQALWIPVLDDRLCTPSVQQSSDPVLTPASVEGMWLHYLGEGYDRSRTSPYAAPLRAETLAGLPPAFIQVNGRCPLRDEGLDYARRLMADGVPVELHCAPGLFHDGEPLPSVAARARRILLGAIEAAVHGEQPA